MTLSRKTLLTGFALLALAGCRSADLQTVQEPWKLPASYQEERRFRRMLSLNDAAQPVLPGIDVSADR